MKLNYFLLITFLFSFSCCKKKTIDYNSLPEYFECKINGKYFTYSNGSSFLSDPDGLKVVGFGSGGWCNIYADAKAGNLLAGTVQLTVNSSNLLGHTEINLGGNASQGGGVVIQLLDSPQALDVYTDSVNSGKLILTKNTNTLIEGTFYFNCVSQTGYKAQVTDGKFKIKI
jgi:hypothetical protein